MEIYLNSDRHGRIREASFVPNGCGPTMACGSMLTSMVRGKLLGQPLEIAAQELIGALGGLPEESLHCAELTVRTLRAENAKAGCDDG
jgi:nitrogen fixation NifU-like protein